MSFFNRILPSSIAPVSKKKQGLVLRSDLAHDPVYDGAQTLAAFSPDIIPLSDAVERHDLAKSFNSFVAHPLHEDQANRVWLRAHGSGPVGQVSVLEIPNELVLWPQTWAGAPSLGELKLAGVDGAASDVVVSETFVTVPKKLHEPGTHSTLIALAGGLNRLTFMPRNWREFVEHFGASESMAAYNVLSVEPCLEQHELRTRLRVFDNEHDTVEMRLSLEGVGIPKTGVAAGVKVISGTDEVLYTLDRVDLHPNSLAPGIDIRLPAGFDGHVHVEVLKKPDVNICDYASVSLVCTALRSDGTTALLGAEHMLFDSSITLKKYCDVRMKSFAASSFYFRAFMGDGAPPRRRYYAFSPDIQPTGQAPESNPGQTFGNFNIDVATQRGNKIVPNASNFIYSRVTAQRGCSATARMFAVPNAMLLYPTKFHKYSIWDVLHDKGSPNLKEEIAYRGFSSNGAGQIVIPAPFDYFQPAPPGLLAAGSDHYCLVIEAVEGVDPANPNAYSHWPHQDILASTSTFATWLLNEPRVAYRNTTYVSSANSGAISYRTDLSPPEMATASDTWYYELQLENVPVGSQVEVVAVVVSSNPPANLPPNLGISKKTVSYPDEAFPSARFTGIGSDFHLLLTITWYPNGKKPNPTQKFNANAILRAYRGGLMAQTLKPHWRESAVETDLVVFPDYPLFKQDVKAMRTARAHSYAGLRGAMRAYDAPGVINASAVAHAEAAPIVEFVLGSDTMDVAG